ncbi:hypothetical protein PVAND_003926 [Polypedilum vanderplanki]|uniref:Uncharacterized protein n=1 Tax=Polypedilum vanderplanki TaxID=319348 RepID=A0A9J6BWN3_POLVA|nr:hypothetical protein PVAND_003926 [Polypedilum vanderplanki]
MKNTINHILSFQARKKEATAEVAVVEANTFTHYNVTSNIASRQIASNGISTWKHHYNHVADLRIRERKVFIFPCQTGTIMEKLHFLATAVAAAAMDFLRHDYAFT